MMIGSMKDSLFSVFYINLRKVWQFSILLFMFFHVAFYFTGTYLSFLNPLSMYFFLFVSAICIFQKGYIKLNYFLVPMFVFIALLIIGMLYSKQYVYEPLYSYFVTLCIVFCFVNYIESEKDVEYIFKAIMYGGILMVFYAISIYGSSFINAILSHKRVGEIVGNANDVGLRACYSSLIALFFLLNEKCKKIKKIDYVNAFLYGLYYTLTTKGKKIKLKQI